MNDPTPYAPAADVPANEFGIKKVQIRPIELIKRSHALLGDQYWLFFGISLLAILVGSAVPMGIIMGAMMVGIYLCFIHREQGIRVELSTLFKGFDYFLESFLAMLVLLGVSLAVVLPFMIIAFVMVFMMSMDNMGNGQQGPAQMRPGILIGFVVMYPLMIMASLLATLPFIFVFQLIVDRNLKAMTAVRLSIKGVRKNMFGVIWFYLVLMFVSMLLALMCYVPAILFMPVSFGAMYLLYRDIYGPGIQFAAPADAPAAGPQQGPGL